MYLKIDSHKKLRELSAKTHGHPSLRTHIEPGVIRRRFDSTGSDGRRRRAPRDESIETPGFSGKPFRCPYKWHRISAETPIHPPNSSVRKPTAPPSPPWGYKRRKTKTSFPSSRHFLWNNFNLENLLGATFSPHSGRTSLT